MLLIALLESRLALNEFEVAGSELASKSLKLVGRVERESESGIEVDSRYTRSRQIRLGIDGERFEIKTKPNPIRK